MENDTATTTTGTTATNTHTTDTETSHNQLPTPSTVPLPSIVSISTINPSTIPQTTTTSCNTTASPDLPVNILSTSSIQHDNDDDPSQQQSYHLSNYRIINQLFLSLRWLSPRQQQHYRRSTLYITPDNIARTVTTTAALPAAATNTAAFTTTTNTTALLYNTSTSDRSTTGRKVFQSFHNNRKTSILDHIRTVFCYSTTTATTTIPIGYIYTTITIAIISSMFLSAFLLPKLNIPHVKVAMIGNSMIYYNDFPRFMGTCYLYLYVLFSFCD
jgi:hypothetical protein